MGIDYGGDGRQLASGTVFLLPYYMGRYHGFIDELGRLGRVGLIARTGWRTGPDGLAASGNHLRQPQTDRRDVGDQQQCDQQGQ